MEKQLNDLRESFNAISHSMKEMNVRASQLEKACFNANSFVTVKRPVPTDNKDLSADDSVIFKTRERYITPNKNDETNYCTERKPYECDSIRQTLLTPFDTYAAGNSFPKLMFLDSRQTNFHNGLKQNSLSRSPNITSRGLQKM